MGVNDLSSEEIARLYGGWAGRTPTDAAKLFADYPGTWWVAAGWALEAFTGVQRHHADLDLSVLRGELPLLRAHLAGRLDVWTASSGALFPLLPDDDPDAAPDDILPTDCEQVWVRPSAFEPWEYDIQLAPGDSELWIYKRDHRIRMPLTDALWERGGVRYMRPDIQLLYKARGLRDKDQADFTATLPYLDAEQRDWLRASLTRTIPGHPWIAALSAQS